MIHDAILFVALPYASVTLAVVVTLLRAVHWPSTLTSRTSQILESRKLFWGSIPFHWGLLPILLGHLAAVVVPGAFDRWSGEPLRVFMLEATGFALGLWALSGLVILCWRRLSEPRVRAVTTPMDAAVLALMLLSLVTGVLTAVAYPFGSQWFTSVFTPYLWSLATLRPRTDLVTDLPWLVQVHALNFFVLLAVLPFSRLVHLVTVPLGYLVRPWQVVLYLRRPASGAGTERGAS